MFDKSKETQSSLNDAAQSVDEVAKEVKKQMSKFDQTVGSVKAHIRRNKKTYLVGAGCLVAGRMIGHSPEIKQTIGSFNFMWKSDMSNVVVTQVVRRGHPGNIIKCVTTGEVFASQRRAAGATGV